MNTAKLARAVLYTVSITFANLLWATDELEKASDYCTIQSEEEDTCWNQILRLHPTQFSVGAIEVKEKVKHLRDLDSKELKKFLKEDKHLIPVVIGPEGKLYLVDHHHLALAEYRVGIEDTKCKVIANLSKLSRELFWKTMMVKGWTYPYIDESDIPQPFSSLPVDVTGLTDDAYRSLAGELRKAGGYDKNQTPFAEFAWAKFLRARIPAGNGDKEWLEEALKIALKLARSPEAKKLPGYNGED